MTRLDKFRQAAGRFASGVTVVTSEHEGLLYGLTATSFVSLSLNPLLVTVSVTDRSPILEDIRKSGKFAVNILESSQKNVSAYFAQRDRGKSEGGFDEIPTRVEATGAPIIEGTLSWFDCALHTMLDGGDHKIIVGEVKSAGGGTGEPLLYWSGSYRELSYDAENPVQQDAVEIGRIADSLSVQLHMHGMTTEQLLEAQRAVEPAAAALAAQEATDDQIKSLHTLVEKAAELQEEPDKYNPVSLDFHAQLGLLSGNPAIAASVQALSRPRENVYSPYTTPDRAHRTTAAHRAILQAIESRDPEKAQRLMAEHIGMVERNVIN